MEGSSTTDVLPTGEGVLIIDEVKVYNILFVSLLCDRSS